MTLYRTLRVALFPLVLAAMLLPALSAGAAADAEDQTVQCLRAAVNQEQQLHLYGRQLDRIFLAQVYERRNYAPIWISNPDREQALLRALSEAQSHGLDPDDFAIPSAGPIERELLLTDAFERYALALGQGRVAPGEIEQDWAIPAPSVDPVAALERAVDGDVAVTLAALGPGRLEYARLQNALARYRDIADAGGWPVVTVPGKKKLQREDSGQAVQVLRQRLMIEGYLARAAESDQFDKSTEAAVGRFQAAHGIAVDGRVGPGTLAALNVSAVTRVKQIRLNLERWHSMPRDWPATRLEVNVPSAVLTIYENGDPALSMRTVVGAVDHPTPVLAARMNAIIVNPPWNVPISIARDELLPKYEQDPTYFERNRYVFVGREGGLRVQQLPGRGNALGTLKFEMPNIFDVYLHDTPTQLFTRPARALSHGCVRVERPSELARYMLSPQPGWELGDIKRAIASGDTQRIPLTRTLPVYLLYWTAYVAPDGVVQFRDDIYGRDEHLAVALAKKDKIEHVSTLEGGHLPSSCLREYSAKATMLP